MSSLFKVAVVQSAPVVFDLEKTMEKVKAHIQEAASKGVKLILFPEAYLPAYPKGLTFGSVVGSRDVEGRQLWRKYWENSVEIPGEAVHQLGEMARNAQVFLAIGVVERDENSLGTLYSTTLYFAPDGQLVGKHRKLKPTGSERVIWGEGGVDTLTTFNTEIGRIGGLICWENYMPLARMSMYRKGVQIYLAPTADHRDSWIATLKHIACEGRCFVLGCNQTFTKDIFPKNLPSADDEIEQAPHIMARGGSVIISPLGEMLAGPVYNRETILYADLDLTDTIEAKMDFDVIGHYARPDVFQYEIPNQPEMIDLRNQFYFKEDKVIKEHTNEEAEEPQALKKVSA